LKKSEQSLRDLWDTIKHNKIGISYGKEKTYLWRSNSWNYSIWWNMNIYIEDDKEILLE
jgi:hypothetical protein